MATKKLYKQFAASHPTEWDKVKNTKPNVDNGIIKYLLLPNLQRMKNIIDNFRK